MWNQIVRSVHEGSSIRFLTGCVDNDPEASRQTDPDAAACAMIDCKDEIQTGWLVIRRRTV